MTIKAIINGSNGKMGKTVQAAIVNEPDLELVATLGRNDNLGTAIQKTKADVVIDFTLPDCVFDNTKTIIENSARPIIGTSGLNVNQIEELKIACKNKSIGGVIAPNFSLGAVLMMKYAKDAIKYLPNVEIIEMHHQQKVDAPSGTAKKTAEMMAEANQNISTPQNIPIHSVRLPGIFAQQAVIFGGIGETLTIRHESIDRNAMMPGVFLACRKAMNLDHLIYGLEHLL